MTDADAHAISEIDQAEFYTAMLAEDPLGMVIKAAIFLENQIISLIEENIAAPDYLKKIGPDFSDRVHLAAAIGLRRELVSPLLAIGNIRNKFAHRLDATLGKNEADNFHKSFGPEDKIIIEKVYQSVRRKVGQSHPAKFSSLPPQDRFVFCAVTLRGALIAARAQAKGNGHASTPREANKP